MSSEAEIRRDAQILLGVILTDSQALEALRRAVKGDPAALAAVLERYAGIRATPDEAEIIARLTDEFVCQLGKDVKHGVEGKFLMYVQGPHP